MVALPQWSSVDSLDTRQPLRWFVLMLADCQGLAPGSSTYLSALTLPSSSLLCRCLYLFRFTDHGHAIFFLQRP
jgi:hypothetical protein